MSYSYTETFRPQFVNPQLNYPKYGSLETQMNWDLKYSLSRKTTHFGCGLDERILRQYHRGTHIDPTSTPEDIRILLPC